MKRIEQLTYKDDNFKPHSIGLEDIDTAILYYFKNHIKPSVLQNGIKTDVPVVYGSPERWKSVQREGYYRDGANKIMAPFIMFKRNTITNDRSITNKMDANYPKNYMVFSQRYNKRNAYDNFSILNNRVPEKTYHLTVVPDYVRITYDFLIMTYYVDQLNKLIESINYASDSYWGDLNKFKFKVKIADFSTPLEINQGGERSVRCSFTLKLFGHIIPDSVNAELNSLKQVGGVSKIKINKEKILGARDIFF